MISSPRFSSGLDLSTLSIKLPNPSPNLTQRTQSSMQLRRAPIIVSLAPHPPRLHQRYIEITRGLFRPRGLQQRRCGPFPLQLAAAVDTHEDESGAGREEAGAEHNGDDEATGVEGVVAAHAGTGRGGKADDARSAGRAEGSRRRAGDGFAVGDGARADAVRTGRGALDGVAGVG